MANTKILGIKRSTTDNKRYMGGFMPLSIHEYVDLFILAKGISKSQILKQSLEEWISGKCQVPENQTDHLLLMVSDRLNSKWKVLKNDFDNFSDYKKKVKEELQTKGIKLKHIRLILNKMIE